MATLRLQKPLVLNGNNIYPLTTYNQIIMPDGSRWDGESGGSEVNLNGYTVSNASFYAPVDGGSAGQILLASGNNASPYWVNTGTIFTKGITNSNGATAYMGKDSTSGLWVEQDGKLCWMLERSGRTFNSLKVHYYNENGGWSAYGILLDTNNYSDYALPLSGGTITGNLRVDGGITTKSLLASQTSGEASVRVYNDTLKSNLYLYANDSSIGMYFNNSNTGANKNIIRVDTNGTTTFYGNADTATKATQDGNGKVISSTYLPLSGGTMTGALNLANGVWNKVGDDCAFGDHNKAGSFGIKGLNGSTNLTFVSQDGSTTASIVFDGATVWNSRHSVFEAGLTVGSQGSNSYTELIVARKHKDNSNYGKLISCLESDLATADIIYQVNGTTYSSLLFGNGQISTSNKLYGAVWNDYAEYRGQNEAIEPGYITYCEDDGKLKKTTERLQKYEGIVSDTFGFAIGETDDCKTPLAVSGRALVYCDPKEEHFHSGDCVCAGPDGLAYRMTREEIIEFPDRIVGIVSEIPTYETWGTDNVEVNGRIWVKVK